MGIERPDTANDAVFNASEAINAARGYVGLIGPIPSSITSTVRTLVSEGERLSGSISQPTKSMLRRLLKSPSMVAPFYFGLKYLKSDIPETDQKISDHVLCRVYSPMDFAALLTLIYFSRRMRSLVSEDIWEKVPSRLNRDLALAAPLARAIPRMSLHYCLLVAGLWELVPLLFAHHEPKGASAYANHLSSASLPYDLRWEVARWGCSRAELSAAVLQSFGFGVPQSNALSTGLAAGTLGTAESVDPEAYRPYIIRVWLDMLAATKSIPQIAHRGEYYPTQQQSAALLAAVKHALESEMPAWLLKGKEDLGPSKTPNLEFNYRILEASDVDAELEASNAEAEDEQPEA